MNKKGAVLAGRILSELKDLSIILERARQGWEKAQTTHDDFYLDGVALNLHGFYSGLERIFERIASAVDGSIPSGSNWHRELLNQMSIEVPGVRPSVITGVLKENLEEYLGFRHVIRNVYTHHLNPDKMKNLVTKSSSILSTIEVELTEFAEFLKGSEQNPD